MVELLRSIQFLIAVVVGSVYAIIMVYIFAFLITSAILQAKQTFLNQLINKQKNGKEKEAE